MSDQDQPSGELLISVSRPDSSTVVLHVNGDLDLLTAPSLDGELTKLLADSPGKLILDLSNVPFFGSSALAVLIRAAEVAEGRGIRLRLVAVNRAVLRPLEVTQTVELFSIHASVEGAVAAGQ